MAEERLHRQNVVACIWDFDKTLIPGYMQEPIFRYFDLDSKRFWKEVNAIPAYLAEKGQIVSGETIYLNHLLTYVRHGLMKGLNNALLTALGAELQFYQGLPDFFRALEEVTRSRKEFRKHEISLEHTIVSTGLAAMIRGSAIAPFVDNIYGCELIENPPPPGFPEQPEIPLEDGDREVSQIGLMVDNTGKTRYLFEINKGTDKMPDIDVNARIAPEDRRIPFENMVYIADGPSDVPVFSVVRKHGGRAYAVYEPGNNKEFAQNDMLLRAGRVDAYGRADYRPKSDTFMWLTMHVEAICERIVEEQERALMRRVGKAPRHIHKDELPAATTAKPMPRMPVQSEIFSETSPDSDKI
jgi:hypothetical protein